MRVVRITWLDAASTRYEEDAGLVRTHSVGFLLRRNRRRVQIAQTRQNRAYADILTIPAGDVLHIRRLK